MVDPKVVKAMMPYFSKEYGNASSVHKLGINAKEAIEKARAEIAKSINANKEEITFTSGGTESDNLAIKGIAFANKQKGNHIITTQIEHKAILKPCKLLEKQDFNVTYLPVDKEGFVNAENLDKPITDKTILVSIIHGNSEIGTIQNLEELGAVCKKHDVYFHTDACQSYTKTDIDVKKQNLDLVTISSHKIHGPKGVGALYARKGINIAPLFHGGEHEFGLRAGTENVPGIVGFAAAVKVAGFSNKNQKQIEHMTKLRDKLIEGALKIPGSRLNGPKERLCNNINLSFRGIEGEALGGYLDQKWVCSSTGSACSSRTLEPSHVLKAIGLSDEEAHGSLRLTLSKFNTEKEIDYVLKILPKYVEKLRKISPFGKIKKVFEKNRENKEDK